MGGFWQKGDCLRTVVLCSPQRRSGPIRHHGGSHWTVVHTHEMTAGAAAIVARRAEREAQAQRKQAEAEAAIEQASEQRTAPTRPTVHMDTNVAASTMVAGGQLGTFPAPGISMASTGLPGRVSSTSAGSRSAHPETHEWHGDRLSPCHSCVSACWACSACSVELTGTLEAQPAVAGEQRQGEPLTWRRRPRIIAS